MLLRYSIGTRAATFVEPLPLLFRRQAAAMHALAALLRAAAPALAASAAADLVSSGVAENLEVMRA